MSHDDIWTFFHRFQKATLTERSLGTKSADNWISAHGALLHRIQSSVDRPKALSSTKHQRKHLVRSLGT